MRRKQPRSLAAWTARHGGLPPRKDLARFAWTGDAEAADLLLDWLRLDLLRGEFRFLDEEPLRHVLAGLIDAGRLEIKQTKRPPYSERERRADAAEIVSPHLALVLQGRTLTDADAKVRIGDPDQSKKRRLRAKADYEQLEGIVAAKVAREIRGGSTEGSAFLKVAAAFKADGVKASPVGVERVYRRVSDPGHQGHWWIRMVLDAPEGGEKPA